jgi:hypothetical protein
MRRGGTVRIRTWSVVAMMVGVLATGCGSEGSQSPWWRGEATQPGAQPTGGAKPAKAATTAPEVWGALVTAMSRQTSVEHWQEWSVSGATAAETFSLQRQRSWVDAASQNYYIDYLREGPRAAAGRSACKDGRFRSYTGAQRDSWYEMAKPCDPPGAVAGGLVSGGHVGDGILPPAMTPDEAGRFVSVVNAVPGLVNPSVERVQQQGKEYLRLTLDLARSGDQHEVTGWLLAARKQVDPNYMMKPVLVENFETGDNYSPVRAVYWLDPATFLPAYVEVVTTVMRSDGTPTGAVRLRRTEFRFGGSAPESDIAKAQPLPTLSWPRMGTQPQPAR